MCYNINSWVWIVSCNIGMTCVTTQTVGLNCFLQHWYDLCYNTNSCFETLFLVLQHWATLVWLVLQHKQLVWNVSCNIGMTCVTTQTVALKCFLQHWYDLCYNTNSCFELFLATLVWLVLQHKQLLWTVSCNIGMTCVTTQTVLWTVSCNIGMTCVTTQTVFLNCFLQHWHDLCYNTNSWVWIVSCNIGMTCVTTQTVALNCFLQHWYDLCYNTNSCFEMFLTTLVWLVLQHKQLVEVFLATLVWLVLQHKQLVWIVSCNIGMTCVTTQTVGLNCFLQHWYDLCYNTNSWSELFLATLVWLVLQHKQLVWMFLTTLVWLVLQHKQLLWTVSYNIGMTCVTTQTVALNCFLQHWYDLCYNTNSALNCFLQHWYDLCYNTNSWSELFLTTLVWLVLQHKQLLWIVSYNIGMTCVTTQTVSLNCFLQHWYDLCYNTNSWSELFLTTLVWLVLQHKQLVCIVSNNMWLVLQHKQLLWNVSYNIGMTCVTTQTVALNCFLQHWYDLCYNTNSCFEMFLATLVWLVLQHKQLVWNVSCNIGMTCVTTQTVGLNCFLQHWYDLCYNTNSWSELFLATLAWLVLQHKQLLWNVSYNIGMTCVTTQTVALNCFLQHWYDLCYNTNSCFEMFLATLVWLVLQHKQLLLKCFLQHWYDLCYNTNSWSEMFLATLVWLVLQHKQLLWNVSCNIGMTCVTTQTVALNCFLQHWYDLCYNTNSCFEMFLATLVWLVLQHKQLLWNVPCNIGMTCVTTQTVGSECFL